MWLMDDVTICDVRARDTRIWEINSQHFRVRKIWKTWFLDIGAFSWFIPFNSYWRSTSIVKNSCCQEDAPLLNFSVENAENWEKQQTVATPLLFDRSEQTFCRTCFSMGELSVQVSVRSSVRSSVRPSIHPSVNIYPGCFVSATLLTVLYRSFWNYACVFVMVWGCAWDLDIIVGLFFVSFSTLWT